MKMKALIIAFILLLHLIALVKTQSLEKDQVALICPKGLLTGGVSWYYQANKKNFTICINCKPEREGHYQWIEICFANNEEPLAGPFGWYSQSCEYKPFVPANQFMQKLCQDNKLVCGFSIKTGIATYQKALRSVQSIPCLNVISDPTAIVSIMPNTADYDVELVCPENTTLFGFERFYLPISGGKIPVLSAICKLKDNFKDSWIFIHAKGMLNDNRMMDSLYKHKTCPNPSVKDGGTGCKFLEKSSLQFCGLKWHSTRNEESIFELLNCSTINIIKPPGKENNQHIYIIIGTCCVFFIVISICITQFKNSKRNEGIIKKDEDEIDTISRNPYYDSGQLEVSNIINNPYYEENNVDNVEMSRNPYYGSDEERTPVVDIHQNPYYE